MSTVAATSLLSRVTRRRRDQRPQEAADMGTAFGMEQCLDERARGTAARRASDRLSWWARWWPGNQAR